MNKNLEERKIKWIQSVEEEQSRKPKRWWQARNDSYQTTEEVGRLNTIVRQPYGERIIRYNLKRALISSALFLSVTFLFMNLGTIIEEGKLNGLEIHFFVFAAFVLYTPIRSLNRKPRMILDKNGLWICKGNIYIEWENIAASYIKKVDDDNTSSYYLQIHYYNVQEDLFNFTEMYIDDLDIKMEELAAEIEYRKSSV